MNYEQREALKDEGWQEVHDSRLSVEDRACGLLKVIESHFERSAAAHYRQYRRYPPHGNFDEYAASWLAANGDRTDGPFRGLQPVIESLRLRYPPPQHPRITRGHSYWDT